MIKTFVDAESMVITDFRIRRWFQSISKAESEGWRVVSVGVVPGWFVDYYTARFNRNSGLEIKFDLGPVKDRI